MNWMMTDISSVNALGSSGVSDLFQILRDGKPRTRSELAHMLGLARSTVGIRLEALMQLGLVGFVDDAVSTGGRPSSRVALKAGNGVVLGVDIGASHLRVAISDLTGHRLLEESRAIEISAGPETVLNNVIEIGKSLLSQSGRVSSELLSIGVGVPGPVEFSTGRPNNPPIMPGWDSFDIPGYFHDHFHVPTLVDNDVNLMALGERDAAWPDAANLIFVKVATGIGAGIIANGILQRGADGVAGDIGHIRVSDGDETSCHCGNRGCLEALASGPAVASRLRRLGMDATGGEDVVNLVRMGSGEAVHAVRQAGRDVGKVLSACISIVNPSVIVIGGSLAMAGEHFIAGVREVVYSRTTPLATQHLQIVESSSGPNAGVLGASMLAIHHTMSPRRIQAMVSKLSETPAV